MIRYLPELAQKAVPRYTSYPTAAEFTNSVNSRDQAKAIAAIGAGAPVSLYVHIPYCREICFYCACNTGPAGKPERQQRYLVSLEQEAAHAAALLRGEVISIHFGGGSPNAISPDQFEALVGLLRRTFTCAQRLEIAVELDPRTLDRTYAEALARAGVTRVSLGVQTFAPHVQRAIGRVQPFAQVAQAVADLRAVGIRHIAFDLMYGLPEQSSDDLEDTIAQAVTLSPDRVAVFGYAHVPSVQARQRAINASTLPGGEERFAQSLLAYTLLTAEGYQAIGFDHFARSDDSLAQKASAGKLRRNFQGFADEAGTAIIGLGASAISQFDGLLVQNEKHEGAYRRAIAATGLAGHRGIVRTADDRLRADAIERLLCDGSLDLQGVAARHGRPPEAFATALPDLVKLEALDLVRRTGWRLWLTEGGRPYARVVASSFDAWRSGSAGTFSRAV